MLLNNKALRAKKKLTFNLEKSTPNLTEPMNPNDTQGQENHGLEETNY